LPETTAPEFELISVTLKASSVNEGNDVGEPSHVEPEVLPVQYGCVYSGVLVESSC